MNFIAEVDIMPHKELLDPQGKTVTKNMKNLDLNNIEDVRIGKHVTIKLSADSEADARQMVETACKKILANVIMETFTYELEEVK